MEIGPVEPDSVALAIVADWYFREWGYLRPGLTADMIQAQLSERIQSSQFENVFVATENDKVLGACELKYNEVKFFPEYVHWIGGVFVVSEYRNKGIGNDLISFAIDECRDQRIQNLYLQTESKNVQLYSKLGWHQITDIEIKGINRTIMKYSM